MCTFPFSFSEQDKVAKTITNNNIIFFIRLYKYKKLKKLSKNCYACHSDFISESYISSYRNIRSQNKFNLTKSKVFRQLPAKIKIYLDYISLNIVRIRRFLSLMLSSSEIIVSVL